MTYKPDVADIRESPALEITTSWPLRGPRWRSATRGRVADTPARRTADGQQTSARTLNLVLIHYRHADVDHDWLASHIPQCWIPTVHDQRRPGCRLIAVLIPG